jgi:uncharacterized protein
VKTLDPRSVILFGSRARGKADDASDVDLLIVRDTEERPIDRRIAAEKAVVDRGLTLDLFVYTPAEMRYLHGIGSPFIEEILAEGRVLYWRKATEQWLRDCEEEISSAEILLAHGKYRGACFHGRQCVEKCLKTLIIEKGAKPEKTHDIVGLLSHAERLGWKVGLAIDEAVFLNSVYKGLYPSEGGLLPHGEPSGEDAGCAVKTASHVMEACRRLLA